MHTPRWLRNLRRARQQPADERTRITIANFERTHRVNWPDPPRIPDDEREEFK